jgi:predicted HicB family RNase H-like nuclease
VENLFRALGGEVSEGRGSRVQVRLGSNEALFHRPHPKPHTDKGALKSVRRFLSQRQPSGPIYQGVSRMNTMTHDGYVATLEFDEETGVISGVVQNVRATLHFQGETVAQVRAAFVDAIADYRDWRAAEGREPEKPYSGTLSLRSPPDLHRRVAVAAAGAGKSINGFIAETLQSVAP